MKRLTKLLSLKPSGVALRFFAASLMEDLLSGVFPLATCLPFGSSINGFGKCDSDLDMVLSLEDEHKFRPALMVRKSLQEIEINV